MHQKNALVVLAVLVLATSSLQAAAAAEAATVCLLKLSVDPKQSVLTGGGSTSAPFDGIIATTKTSVAGSLWLRVPANSSCPPKLTADNVDALLQQASLELPVGSPSLTARTDIKSNVTVADDPSNVIAKFDFLGMGMGLQGTEPLGPGAVTVGTGSVREARSAVQKVCSQLLLLNGTLDLTNKISGARTADVKNTAYNRTLSAGVSVAKSGNALGNATLFLANVTLFLNIAPESRDGTGTPGVEFSKAVYTLAGDVVATADLGKASSWQEVAADKVAWGSVPRKDAPVVIGAPRPGKPRYIGQNSSAVQECKPSRVLDGSGTPAAATGDAAKKSAAGAPAGAQQVVAVAAFAALVAGMLML